MTAAEILRAIAAACDECDRIAHNAEVRHAAAAALQRDALARGLLTNSGDGWAATAAALRSVADEQPTAPRPPDGWSVKLDHGYLRVHSPYRMVATVGPKGSVSVGDLYFTDGAGLVAALAHALVEVTRG